MYISMKSSILVGCAYCRQYFITCMYNVDGVFEAYTSRDMYVVCVLLLKVFLLLYAYGLYSHRLASRMLS